MICKRCMVIMESGTQYHQKKNNKDMGYRRYNKCPKCYDKVYNNSPNFQETLVRELEKSKRK